MNFATSSTPATDFPIGHSAQPVRSDCPQRATIGVGESRLSHVTDEERERLIRRAGRMMRLSMARWERYGCFGDRGLADYWRLTMEADIWGRSAAFVQRREQERGLGSGDA